MVGFFVQAPIWGSHHIPKQVLVGTCALMAIVMYPVVPVPKGLENLGDRMMHGDFAPFIFYIIQQFTVGLVIGYFSFLIMASVQFGAECLDVQMGLSVAASFDPASHGAVNMLRRWAFYLAMILYLLFNFHHKALEAMRFSYDVIPLDSMVLSHKLIEDMMTKTGYIFIIGLQVAAPIVASLFVTQVALGLLARVAPQMNVFMLSFPLNIAIGLTLLGACLLILRDRLQVLFDEEIHWMWMSIRYMVPPHGFLIN
jgi:flagellar biosynthetic protein FliR